MDRRRFILAASSAAAAPALIIPPAEAGTADIPPASQVEALNPSGIEVAGIRMVSVAGGKYKVWTKRIGYGDTKVLLLHGGPGLSHEYLEVMESFLPRAGIEMYYYDQLGCNNSDAPEDPSLWTTERYVQEVEDVRRGLGLEQFVLYGHSWGGILGIEYALRYQQQLRGLVISNMAASTESYLRHVVLWKRLLTPASRASLRELESRGDYDSPNYGRIMMEELYPQILCRTRPWPEPVTRTLRHMNSRIYEQMQGKSEFVVTGNLKGWDRWADLRSIRTRTLTIGARYDEMDPQDMQKMAGLLPRGSYAYLENGSHLCMWDDQASYFQKLLAFLHAV
jgi:proline iminopeptidase